jgi:hypothetical protein
MWRESSSGANPDSSSEEGTSNSMKTKRLLSRNVLAKALQIRSQKMNCAHRTLKEMHKPWLVNVRIGRVRRKASSERGRYRGGTDEVWEMLDVLRIDRGSTASRLLRGEGVAETEGQREIRTEKSGC